MIENKALIEATIICQTKEPYRSRTIAQRALNAIQKGKRIHRTRTAIGKIIVYRCEICRKYHHGHDRTKWRKVRYQCPI